MNFISGQAFITMMDSLFNEEEWNRHVLYITANSAAIHLQKRSTTIHSQPIEYQISFLVHLPTLEKRLIVKTNQQETRQFFFDSMASIDCMCTSLMPWTNPGRFNEEENFHVHQHS
ncbi:hypothetical protein AS033_05955 [Exiguobacterium indicum]|uniref:Uncharacterized protein n=1 Tax=Exiguobacterium indicum TaxID=296995 RepID=A0A0V8GL50_9BACL|nr:MULTISPECIES: hypothetical protein [Exiguobacterium]KSU50922.1 hypothetical protein AS033_05955 [Exiguobacterium enclense]KTR27831.1 hypothetical protein RSA11_03965 [Exiguobacterium indicum]SDC15856.1 hypothetical protein SAMN05216342_1216 [Exiguobacterium enclense]